MATVNKALKKRAQAFAAEHGLPYLKALHAVDEPLHRLRDITLWTRNRCAITRGHFRLVGERGIFTPAFEPPARESDYWGLIRNEGLESFGSYDGSFFIEAARRIQLFKDRGLDNIWTQRMLSRAGLIEEEPLEPIFHHYAHRLDPEGGLTMIHNEGHRLGIYSVNISGILGNRDSHATLPVTRDELAALRDGSYSGTPRLPWGDWAARMGDGPRSLNWTVTAHTLLTSKARTRVLAKDDQSLPQVALLLGAGASSPEEELRSRGLLMEDFDVADVTGLELKYYLISEFLHVYVDRKIVFRNTTQNFVEIGEGFLEARPEFYG